MKNRELLKFIQFCTVGSLGLAIDMGITWFGKEQLQLNPYLANTFGFSAAVISNYLLNKYWTFEERTGISAVQFLRFVMVSIGGLLLSTLFLTLMFGVMGLHFYVAKLLVTGIVVIWNYSVNRFLVFKKQSAVSMLTLKKSIK